MTQMKWLWTNLTFDVLLFVVFGILGIIFVQRWHDPAVGAVMSCTFLIAGLARWRWPAADAYILIVLGVEFLILSIVLMARHGVSIGNFIMIPAGGLFINWGL